MQSLSKKDYEDELLINRFMRKWVVVPSCVLSLGMLFYDALNGTGMIVFWLLLSVFNFVNLWHNNNLKQIYETAVSFLEGQEQLQRVAALNPHRK